ncbi:MAG: hypothetical protein M1298_00605 [Chloroflexi bacterium]|nr:hypothetical protein [Chloroflexota bacterium]
MERQLRSAAASDTIYTAAWRFLGVSVQTAAPDRRCITALERGMGTRCADGMVSEGNAVLRIAVRLDERWQEQSWLADVRWLWSAHGHRLGRIGDDAVVLLEGMGVARLLQSEGVIDVSGNGRLAEDTYVFNDVLVTPLLHSAMARWGWVAVHACAMEHVGSGILIVAASGGGKSTLALALLRAGWRLVADDRVLLRADGDGVVAWGTVELPRISPGTFHLFPDLARLERTGRTSGGKWEYDPRMLFGDCVIPWVRVEHLVLPQIKETDVSSFHRADAVVVLKELLAATEFGAYGAARSQAFQVLSQMVAQSRLWHLHFGRDVQHIGELFARSPLTS